MEEIFIENFDDFFLFIYLFVFFNYRSLVKFMILVNCLVRKLVSCLSQLVRLVVDQFFIYLFSQLVKELFIFFQLYWQINFLFYLQFDSDNDEFGDDCDKDKDGDGVLNIDDNCFIMFNENQVCLFMIFLF